MCKNFIAIFGGTIILVQVSTLFTAKCIRNVVLVASLMPLPIAGEGLKSFTTYSHPFVGKNLEGALSMICCVIASTVMAKNIRPFPLPVSSKYIFCIKFCPRLNSNHGPLVSEATPKDTLPDRGDKQMLKLTFTAEARFVLIESLQSDFLSDKFEELVKRRPTVLVVVHVLLSLLAFAAVHQTNLRWGKIQLIILLANTI